MTTKQIKETFASIYRKACKDGEISGNDRRELESIKGEASSIQDAAIEDGDTGLWTEMFNQICEIDQLLGIDYADDGVCLV
jgi:hypothetical protein